MSTSASGDTSSPPVARSRRGLALLVVVTALVTAPVAAFATHQFSDVTDGSTHAAAIAWLADTSVTAGCSDTAFCAKDEVTREQMATFLYRLSGNDPAVAPVINAATIQGVALNDVGGAVADAACPTDEVVTGFSGGSIVCSTVRSLTSANGTVTVSVTDAGVRMDGPDGSFVELTDEGLVVQSAADVVLVAGNDVLVESLDVTLRALGTARIDGTTVRLRASGPTFIEGLPVSLNGSCAAIATVGGQVSTGTIVSCSSSVFAC